MRPLIQGPTAISLGKFDGLHSGHRLLIRELQKKKQQTGLQTVLFTFELPPRMITAGDRTGVLTTNAEKEAVFAKTGIDYLIEYPFTEEVRAMEPEAFIRMLSENLHVACIISGPDFRFGRDRSGDNKTIQALSQKYGYEAVTVEKLQYEGREISSTRIREAILDGEIELANHLLGYDFFIRGDVIHGNRIGHTIGFPTINLAAPHEKLLPPYGVYASRIRVKDRIYEGISNIGVKPTIGADNPVGIETYLYDFSEETYGQTMDVALCSFLRKEKKFDSLAELKKQLQSDLADGRVYHKRMDHAEASK